eukprot:4758925-Heterocapsa_arctica.AAC.1
MSLFNSMFSTVILRTLTPELLSISSMAFTRRSTAWSVAPWGSRCPLQEATRCHRRRRHVGVDVTTSGVSTTIPHPGERSQTAGASIALLPSEGWAGDETMLVPSGLVTDRRCHIVRGMRRQTHPLLSAAAHGRLP